MRLKQHAIPQTLFLLFAFCANDIAVAETIVLSAPDSASAGSEIEVSWTGTGSAKDFIIIIVTGAKENTYARRYRYVSKGSPVTITMPDEAGDYEIRYLHATSYDTLARRPIQASEINASLTAPATISAGADIEITWTGPNNPRDFITVVKVGAKARTYENYKYITQGKTLTLVAPDEEGEYELRYLTGQNYRTLGTAPITVTSTSATLTAPPQVVAGAAIELTWSGPDNPRDFVTIVAVGAKNRTYEAYQYTKSGKNLTLKAPEIAGEYELRYLTGQDYNTLASLAIKVMATSASIESPATVEVGRTIEVSWEGPGNDRDYVMIVPAGAKENSAGPYAYVRRGKQLRVNAPKEVGDYEVRYVTGAKRFTLASNPLKVHPSRIPGELKVVMERPTPNASSDMPAVAIILDASGSMLQKLDGERRINIAKAAITDLVNNTLAEGTPVALRVFGHREADACRTDLEIPLGLLNRAAFTEKIARVEAQNLAKTPIARSLELVAADLEGVEGKHVVILVTDGEETCDGDPRTTIEKLRSSGYNIRINIVGFAIDELMLRETFQEWARLGGGRYFDAQNAEELKNTMQQVMEVAYEVMDMEDNFVTSGVVGGPIIKVLPGTYKVRVLGNVEQIVEDIQIKPEELTTLRTR